MSGPRQVQAQVLQADAHGRVALCADHVVLELPARQRALSFALHGGGLGFARAVAIHEVKNADLPPEVNARALLAGRMHAYGAESVGMLTSRRVAAVELATSARDAVFVRAIVTCGLSNALRVGDPPGPLDAWGTINIILQLNVALEDAALVEALSLVTEARTTAVIALGMTSRRSGLPATGTGTDCIALVAPLASVREAYAGKHTLIGHLIGDAVLGALVPALTKWKAEYFG